MIPQAYVIRIDDTWCEVDVYHEIEGMPAVSHLTVDEQYSFPPSVSLHETFFEQTEIMTDVDNDREEWLRKFALDAWIDSESQEKGATM